MKESAICKASWPKENETDQYPVWIDSEPKKEDFQAMLHENIRNDVFKRKTALQHRCNIV